MKQFQTLIYLKIVIFMHWYHRVNDTFRLNLDHSYNHYYMIVINSYLSMSKPRMPNQRA